MIILHAIDINFANGLFVDFFIYFFMSIKIIYNLRSPYLKKTILYLHKAHEVFGGLTTSLKYFCILKSKSPCQALLDCNESVFI